MGSAVPAPAVSWIDLVGEVAPAPATERAATCAPSGLEIPHAKAQPPMTAARLKTRSVEALNSTIPPAPAEAFASPLIVRPTCGQDSGTAANILAEGTVTGPAIVRQRAPVSTSAWSVCRLCPQAVRSVYWVTPDGRVEPAPATGRGVTYAPSARNPAPATHPPPMTAAGRQTKSAVACSLAQWTHLSA